MEDSKDNEFRDSFFDSKVVTSYHELLTQFLKD